MDINSKILNMLKENDKNDEDVLKKYRSGEVWFINKNTLKLVKISSEKYAENIHKIDNNSELERVVNKNEEGIRQAIDRIKSEKGDVNSELEVVRDNDYMQITRIDNFSALKLIQKKLNIKFPDILIDYNNFQNSMWKKFDTIYILEFKDKLKEFVIKNFGENCIFITVIVGKEKNKNMFDFIGKKLNIEVVEKIVSYIKKYN